MSQNKEKKIMLLIKGKKLIISNINSKNLIIFKNSNEKYINSISIFESEKKSNSNKIYAVLIRHIGLH